MGLVLGNDVGWLVVKLTAAAVGIDRGKKE